MGVNVTEKQTELLKWRSSPESQKYYTDKENQDFYKAVLKGDTKVIDAIRKEKQQRINDLKNNVLSVILFLFMIPLVTCSCSLFNNKSQLDMKIIEQRWDSNSLTDKDRTYKLDISKPVKIETESKSIFFKGNWYIVNEDFIKTFNENQDTLLKSLEKTNELKNKNEQQKNILVILSIVSFICIFIMFLKRKG